MVVQSLPVIQLTRATCPPGFVDTVKELSLHSAAASMPESMHTRARSSPAGTNRLLIAERARYYSDPCNDTFFHAVFTNGTVNRAGACHPVATMVEQVHDTAGSWLQPNSPDGCTVLYYIKQLSPSDAACSKQIKLPKTEGRRFVGDLRHKQRSLLVSSSQQHITSSTSLIICEFQIQQMRSARAPVMPATCMWC